MRITHVVTLVSDDAAYGGPVSVATGQLAALAERGHQVALLALWRGAGPAPAALGGVPLRAHRARTLVPGQGFLGLLHPGLVAALWRAAGEEGVLHVHAGRDLVSLTAVACAVLRRRPFLVQTHGMVAPRGALLARCFDLLYLPLLRRARQVLALTGREEAGLRRLLGRGRRGARLARLPNGVRPPAQAPPPAARPAGPVPDVLFLARLHARKRPEAFVRMAALVRREHPDAEFTLHGADEGQLAPVRRLIAAERLEGPVRYGGPLDHAAALRRIARATVYVLPSVDEPFPMGVLEAMAAGTPVVCTASCGIAEELGRAGAALVTDGSPAALARAVSRLVDDAALHRRVAAAGRSLVAARFSVDRVADRLERLYAQALEPGPPATAVRPGGTSSPPAGR
ncbi:glycosyltransferase [Streptomyces sp. NPDC059740]|uniref:glycosyltransferase n=1 Tax=Streptomyces sp. NPDC059740 TaxID=3346926 RepID=UPI0036597AA5